ncbi:MAG: hypothetical protein KBB01_02935 [Candidatus Omnitrophica bacterium]|nr:hypothetical protein [Candidatus Omnitrophota bacterium]
MKIGLSLFLSSLLGVSIVIAFILEWVVNSRISNDRRRKIRLERRKCEICASVYFTSIFFEFWRCPFCGSLNKEK